MFCVFFLNIKTTMRKILKSTLIPIIALSSVYYYYNNNNNIQLENGFNVLSYKRFIGIGDTKHSSI